MAALSRKNKQAEGRAERAPEPRDVQEHRVHRSAWVNTRYSSRRRIAPSPSRRWAPRGVRSRGKIDVCALASSSGGQRRGLRHFWGILHFFVFGSHLLWKKYSNEEEKSTSHERFPPLIHNAILGSNECDSLLIEKN